MADLARLIAPGAEAVARFRGDLAGLIDIERDTLLVAVSGGGDSLALLLLAHAVLGARCQAATVDHGLRAAGAEEAGFVAEVCAARGIEHVVLTAALPDRSGRTANVSARARDLRYALLEAHRGAIGAAATATAHHADDQLETLVMRLNRGSGVAGLAGVRARSGPVVRPLLGWRRAELAAIVARAGLVAVDDPSNVDDRFDRARLRKALAGADWLDPVHATQSATALGDAEDALEWMVARLFAERCTQAEGRVVFLPADLPFELRRRLVAACLAALDPQHDVRGGALARAVQSLDAGNRVSLGSVLCTPVRTGAQAWEWRFVPAPARRG